MKKILFVMLSVIMAATLWGCGSSTVTNEQAGKAVKKALEARWELEDNKAFWADYTSEGFGRIEIAMAETELEPLEKYRDADFEDPAMAEAFGKYIGILDEMKAMGENYDGDFWTDYYNDLVYTDRRRNVLKETFELAGIDVEKEENPSYRLLMNDAYYEDIADDAELVDEAFTVIDAKADNGAAGFQVKNNTTFTFPEYAVCYRVYDADGNKKAAQLYAFIHEFEGGSTQWTEDISSDLEDGNTVEAFAYKAGANPGDYYNMVKFDKEIVLKR